MTRHSMAPKNVLPAVPVAGRSRADKWPMSTDKWPLAADKWPVCADKWPLAPSGLQHDKWPVG
jgi:hypothetical protein